MNNPAVTEGLNCINFAWPELKLRVEASRYNDEGNAELVFYSSNGSGEMLLHTTRVNLLSTTTINSLNKRLKENSESIPWPDVLTFITGKTLQIARRGEPVIELWPNEEDTLSPEYLLEPVLYLNHPSVLFGDYGSCKSLLALGIAYIVQLPYQANTLGFITKPDSSRCLYLDYEDDPSSFRRRWSALERGFGQGAMPILYRRMTAPLFDCVEQVQKIISDKKVVLLIVDSLGPAARGNLNDPEPAIKYHVALRQIGITSLTLAHTSKDQLTKKRTIFGSVFFTNLARSIWEAKSEQETGEAQVTVSLKQMKANLSKLHLPLGYKINFADDTIKITPQELADTGLSGELPLSVQIKDLLRRGAMSTKAIAEALEANEGSVKTTANRMKGKGVLTKVGELWGLKQ